MNHFTNIQNSNKLSNEKERVILRKAYKQSPRVYQKKTNCKTSQFYHISKIFVERTQ